jgi:choline dehydrogenase-like flavoprotein
MSMVPLHLLIPSIAPRFVFRARREVIVSAGAIATPQLLTVSGIGDPALMAKHKIKSIVNLPEVGRNLVDQPYVALHWTVNSKYTYDNYRYNKTLFLDGLFQYTLNKTGPLTNNAMANHVGFFRLPSDSKPMRTRGDPTAGPFSPHFELIFRVSS